MSPSAASPAMWTRAVTDAEGLGVVGADTSQ